VAVLTPRKKVEPTTLMISVERRGGRSLSVSIRGSTWGVLFALALMGAAAWLLMR
jgi:flagellar biogenesis protein FliO